jgi:hypothetical protein
MQIECSKERLCWVDIKILDMGVTAKGKESDRRAYS